MKNFSKYEYEWTVLLASGGEREVVAERLIVSEGCLVFLSSDENGHSVVEAAFNSREWRSVV